MQESLAQAMGYFTFRDTERYHLNIDAVDVLWHLANVAGQIGRDPKVLQAAASLAEKYRGGNVRIVCRQHRRQVLDGFWQQINTARENAPLMQSGLLGSSVANALDGIEFLKNNEPFL